MSERTFALTKRMFTKTYARLQVCIHVYKLVNKKNTKEYACTHLRTHVVLYGCVRICLQVYGGR
ncbi:hypothetical protein C7437_10212 [Psychrobacillus insolitus]|uniref:Uncharacterized protein n=1 Tax=Psychrobacillus insolitus TaxID=1461 RepID=A0A2W7MHF6_9BACI|nr:hypothetical protein [Psychrobacillus insolitus]PZX05561.1 hypothetical protein C7437_10212 [Psychrobacillus insolitus]